MQNFQTKRFYYRKLLNSLMLSLASLTVLFGLFWLAWILFTLIIKGLPAISWDLFILPTTAPNEKGGLFNAILGSTLIVISATLIATPIGIFAGTYLSEYGRYNFFSKVTRFINDILLSAPSIVIGLFIYVIYVEPVKHYSAWAGAIALAIIMIPVIIRTTDNMLELIPNNLREAAFALGCPPWKVIIFICYRAARSGMITGILLSIARISGETAPLLFTSLSNQFTSWDMNAPMANLPLVIYQYAASPFTDWNNLAWAGATLITFFVLALNIFTRIFFNKQK